MQWCHFLGAVGPLPGDIHQAGKGLKADPQGTALPLRALLLLNVLPDSRISTGPILGKESLN